MCVCRNINVFIYVGLSWSLLGVYIYIWYMCSISFIKSEKFRVPKGLQVRPEIRIILKSKIDFRKTIHFCCMVIVIFELNVVSLRKE